MEAISSSSSAETSSDEDGRCCALEDMEEIVATPCRSRAFQQRKIELEGEQAAEAAMNGRAGKPQQLPDGTYVTAKYWGINLEQIEELFEECRNDKRWSDQDSVRDFVQKFIVPKTREHGLPMGYALMVNQEEPLEVNLMISHAWNENTLTFFQDVLRNMLSHEVAYICFLSNFQGTSEEINAQLGDDIHYGPFSLVIMNPNCERMLVVPCEELKESGDGLYSRLWCIWEVKTAVDRGLPIHMVSERRSVEYLLGNKTKGSSRHARCGDPNIDEFNRDEQLIRAAIAKMPPQTAQFHSTCTLIIAASLATGPTLCRHFYPDMDVQMSITIGIFLGILLGLLIVVGIARPASKWWQEHKLRDGFDQLDQIIFAASRDRYSYERFQPERDLPGMLLFGVFCCIPFTILEATMKFHTFTIHAFNDVMLDGFGAGMIMFAIWDINKLGPWTGVYENSPLRQRLSKLILVTLLGIGASLGWVFGGWGWGGRIALIGMLLGMIAVAKKWPHRMAMMVTLIVMVATTWLRVTAWREVFVLTFSFDSYTLLPELTLSQRVLSVTIAVCIVASVIVMDEERSLGL